MNTPKISVTILSYNFEKYIGECIESLLAQTLLPFEIVISDDCSADKSWEVIEGYQKRHPKLLKCFRQARNIGPVENSKVVLRAATGELISSMDGDDRWLPGKLEKEWTALQQNPQAKIAYSNVYDIDDQGRRIGVWYDGVGPPPPSGDIFVELFSGKCFPTHMGAFRQELIYKFVLDELPPDENVAIFLDLDIKIRATARYPAAYSGKALIEYRRHGLGIHNSPLEKVFKDLLLVYLKNLPLLASRTAEEGRQIRLSIAQQMFKLVNDIQIVCEDRLRLINRLDDECKRILRDAEERLALILRLENEMKGTQKLNLELQNVCDERLRIIETVEKTADQRLKLIESLDAKCRAYERSVAGGKNS